MPDLTSPVVNKPVNSPVIHDFEQKSKSGSNIFVKTIIIAVIVALGVGTGYFASKSRLTPNPIKSNNKIVKTDGIVGSTDTKTFRDQAEGVIQKGGIDGEGTHKLIRDPKRPDQNVYLTSGVVDLDQFVGKKVKVWGETNSAQKAGWLMDVGKVEVL